MLAYLYQLCQNTLLFVQPSYTQFVLVHTAMLFCVTQNAVCLRQVSDNGLALMTCACLG